MDTARKCSNLKAIVCVTTDKCYENDNEEKSFKESDRLGGSDPYSCSKGCAELITENFDVSKENILILAVIDLPNLGGSNLLKEQGYKVETLVSY